MELPDPVNTKQVWSSIAVAGLWTLLVTGGNKNTGLPACTQQGVERANIVFASREQILDSGCWIKRTYFCAMFCHAVFLTTESIQWIDEAARVPS
jgi:hypothetical protein